MELLNERVINSQYFKSLQLILKNRYIKKPNFIIYYNRFEEIIISFVEEIMYSYLKDTKYYNNEFSCVIKNLPSHIKGEFNPRDKKITINEKVIYDIYLGNITCMTTIFHELNHFKTFYDIKLGKINNDLVRALKEYLLRISTCDPFNENKIIKSDPIAINDNYYRINYELFSDEKIAELKAINNLIFFIKLADIKLSEKHLKELKNRINKNVSQYANYMRDLRLCANFNNYFLDFEEAFDVMIKFNPDWLTIYSQLNIEYYFDENGKVVKRTKDELKARLEIEADEDIKKYIQYLLVPNDKKSLNNGEVFSAKKYREPMIDIFFKEYESDNISQSPCTFSAGGLKKG